jgi:hypothetical protein
MTLQARPKNQTVVPSTLLSPSALLTGDSRNKIQIYDD